MRYFVPLFAFLMTLLGCTTSDQSESINSPNGDLVLKFNLNAAGVPQYALNYKGKAVIKPSSLGLQFEGGDVLQGAMTMERVEMSEHDQTWSQVWGEQAEIRDHHRQLFVQLREAAAPNRILHIYFKLFDYGLGFRYEIPAQESLAGELLIEDELTEFVLTGDHTCWWIPGDWDIYEHLYTESKFSEIDALAKRDHPNLAQTYIPENAVNTPVTMRTDDGLYLSFHEANLTDYSGMTLRINKGDLSMQSGLVGSAEGYKVKTEAPFVTPWRTIQVAEKPGDLITSYLILNLNEPNKLDNTDWIKPQKYMGIWWEMHLAKATWDMASGRHGATTENAKRYIDYASAIGIPALLIEGWNTGWEVWRDEDKKDGAFDFVTPYADFDIEEVVRYGQSKGVSIIGHHETSAAVTRYEEQLDTAFKFYSALGIPAVKTGYVGMVIPRGEYHHGQWMVEHYRRVVKKAAENQVMVDAHEPIKATGIRRTWPNMMTREGLRGQEFNAFGVEGGNNIEHTTTVPFTRMLSGPIDYTPGVFDLLMNEYKPNNRVNHTLAHELALYVVIYSPLQMLSDLPENIGDHPCLKFVQDVGVDWETTLVTDAAIGDHVTIARKEKGTGNWFIGSISSMQEPRDQEVVLDFLDEGKTYIATIYGDAEDAHWETNPQAYEITDASFSKGDSLMLKLAAGGGAAVSLMVQ